MKQAVYVFFGFLAMLFAMSLSVQAETATTVPLHNGIEAPMIEVTDIPTADVLDPATFSTTFRFYNEGGVVSRLIMAPFKRVNLGISFDAQHVIGSGEPNAIAPKLFFKLRAFDGNDYVPALSLGYDNQGYLYQRPQNEFLHKERGVYLVGSHEIFLPGLELHAGVNIPEMEDAEVFGFFGTTYRVIPSFALMAEYDNIRAAPENRVNLGGRFFVTPFFNVDVAARNVGRKGDQGAERIVRLNYTARFPFF